MCVTFLFRILLYIFSVCAIFPHTFFFTLTRQLNMLQFPFECRKNIYTYNKNPNRIKGNKTIKTTILFCSLFKTSLITSAPGSLCVLKCFENHYFEKKF